MYRRISPRREPAAVEPPLSRVALKYNRADEQFKALHKEVRAWDDRNRDTVFAERNADRTEYALKLKMSEFPDLKRWALVAGEILFNLRCVLDHLVYALAVEESGANPPQYAKKLAFPITDSHDALMDEIGKKRLYGLSTQAVNLIASAQPYPGGNRILAVLRDLNNIDKHRMLHLVALNVSEGAVLSPPEVSLPEFEVWVNSEPLEKEATLARVKYSEPHGKLGMEFAFVLTISFWERPQRGEDFITVLWEIVTEVHRITSALAPDYHQPITPHGTTPQSD